MLSVEASGMQQSLCFERLIQNNRTYLDNVANRIDIKTRSKGVAGVARHFISTLIVATKHRTTVNRGFSCK
jgi:hypothetical protein